MKNVSERQLKTAIFLTVDEYETILKEIFSIKVIVHADLDGIWYETDERENSNVEDPDYVDNELLNELAKYFDVKEVTSVHADDCICETGIWIIYKN